MDTYWNYIDIYWNYNEHNCIFKHIMLIYKQREGLNMVKKNKHYGIGDCF